MAAMGHQEVEEAKKAEAEWAEEDGVEADVVLVTMVEGKERAA